MKITVAILLVLTLACTIPLLGEPTPRPTYTPYPTNTPAAPADATIPTISPENFHQVGKGQWFFGETSEAVGRGEEAFARGEYQEALEDFLEAQRLHGEPSPVLQNNIGNSYRALGQNDQAIHHYTNALEIEDGATRRTTRGTAYGETGQCSAAIEDAKIALTMEPASSDGFHTDIEANIILTRCYTEQGDHLAALQHADAAHALAIEHNVRAERLEEIQQQRESKRLVLEGKAWPEDLFSGHAQTTLENGMDLSKRGEYAEAIAKFEEAQKLHGKPSGAIQAQIGHAYSALGQHEKAIEHYSAALEIRDNHDRRVARASEYMSNGRCSEATTDAETALTMEPAREDGFDTYIKANLILAKCYAQQEEYLLALQHADAALTIARENDYSSENLEMLDLARESIQAVQDGQAWPEDLLFEPALSHFNTAIELFEQGRYEEAITSLEAAQEAHSKQSSYIQTMIGMAHGGLENHDTALHHLNKAVEIRDSAFHRANRAIGYMAQDQCQEASNDAETALGMEPYAEPEYHSGSEAHFVLAICQYDAGDLENALRNIRASIDLADQHGYTEEEISDLELIEQMIAGVADGPEAEPELTQPDRTTIYSCDEILRSQLLVQRGASTATRMNQVIDQIQTQRGECPKDVWDPLVIDLDTNADSPAGKCFSVTAGTLPAAAATMPMIGSQVIPTSLGKVASSTKYWVQKESGRDSDNNILVYFSDSLSNRPSDGASCWLYYARLRTWHHG